MKSINEQYREQYNEIKSRYRKRKMKQTIIAGVIAIILLGYAYLNFKKIITPDDFKMAMSFLFGVGAAIIAIRTPFHQTQSEQSELLSLNDAYTQERFRERNG